MGKKTEGSGGRKNWILIFLGWILFAKHVHMFCWTERIENDIIFQWNIKNGENNEKKPIKGGKQGKKQRESGVEKIEI